MYLFAGSGRFVPSTSPCHPEEERRRIRDSGSKASVAPCARTSLRRAKPLGRCGGAAPLRALGPVPAQCPPQAGVEGRVAPPARSAVPNGQKSNATQRHVLSAVPKMGKNADKCCELFHAVEYGQKGVHIPGVDDVVRHTVLLAASVELLDDGVHAANQRAGRRLDRGWGLAWLRGDPLDDHVRECR